MMMMMMMMMMMDIHRQGPRPHLNNRLTMFLGQGGIGISVSGLYV
jgi:hypothetical protein